MATWASKERALTHGDAKYQNPQNSYKKDFSDWSRTLVHESTHVWQNQNGGTDYMSEAMAAQQKARWQSPDGKDFAAYDYAHAIKAGKKWSELNPEQ